MLRYVSTSRSLLLPNRLLFAHLCLGQRCARLHLSMSHCLQVLAEKGGGYGGVYARWGGMGGMDGGYGGGMRGGGRMS